MLNKCIFDHYIKRPNNHLNTTKYYLSYSTSSTKVMILID